MNVPATNVPAVKPEKRSVLAEMAARYGMEPKVFADTITATVFPKEGSNEEFLAFLLVARKYNLNPVTKEIYAFPKRGGGIQPIVSIDGWLNIINSHPQLNGIEFDDHLEAGKLVAITARIWRKDREKPTVVTEYLSECARPTDTWKQYPRRMLRHKALIQCARYAFGFAGIVDPDEAERIGVVPTRDVTPRDRDAGPPLPPTANKSVSPPPPAMNKSPSLVPSPSVPAEPEPIESSGDNGETVVWDDPPQQETLDIPPELDRRAKQFDLESERDWLNDLDGAFAGCESLEQFAAEQKRLMAPKKGLVSPEAWAVAQRLAESTYRRVRND